MSQLVKASTQLATHLGIEPAMMIETIKCQCFPNMRPEQISDAQLAAFVSVANGLDLNPLIPGMLYAYPQRNGGITPVVGPDGVFKKMAEMKGVTYECEVYPEDVSLPPTHAKAAIFVEGKERPHTYTALFKEWNVGNNPNWQSRPRHMIWLRALKQCARQIIHGLPMDEDEVRIAGLVDVTPTSPGTGTADQPAAAPERTPPPKREAKGAAAAKENASRAKVETPPAADPAPTPPPAAPKKDATPVVDAEFTETPRENKPAEEPRTPPAKPEPVTEVWDDTPRAFACRVVSFRRGTMQGIAASAIGELDGEFQGTTYHLGGADEPGWKQGAHVKVTIAGRKLKRRDGEDFDRFAPMVSKIELVG